MSISSPVKLAPGQTPFTTQLRGKATNIDAMEKEFSKIEDDMLKLILKHMEFPPMDGEKSQQADTLGPIVTAQNAKLSMMNARVIADAAEAQSKSSLLQRSAMCGQKVHIDDSVRNFHGKNVNFDFNITGHKIPEKAMMQGNITILDSDDNVVFRKKMNSLLSGKNSLPWDGKGLDGQPVPHGSYKIQVEAYYTEGANENRMPLNASSVKEGEVEKVDIQTGELILTDGTKVDMDSVKFISSGNKPTDDKSQEIAPSTDYNSYIGKTVNIEQNTVKYSGQNDTPVTFLSEGDVQDADVQLHFYRNGKYVAMDMRKMDIKKGQNSFAWTGAATQNGDEVKASQSGISAIKNVEHGTYSYEVHVSTKDQPESVKLDNKKTIYVSGIERVGVNTYFVSENEKYNVDFWQGSMETAPKRSRTELEGAALNFKDRRLRVPNIIDFDGKNPVSITKTIPYPWLTRINELKFEVFDKGSKTLLKTIVADKAAINKNIHKVLIDGMDAESKQKLQVWTDAQIAADASNGQDEEAIFKAKGLYIAANNKEFKWQTWPEVTFVWDGKDDDPLGPKQVTAGQYYYTVTAIIKNPDKTIKTEQFRLEEVVVLGTSVKNDKISLTLSNGKNVLVDDLEDTEWIG